MTGLLFSSIARTPEVFHSYTRDAGGDPSDTLDNMSPFSVKLSRVAIVRFLLAVF